MKIEFDSEPAYIEKYLKLKQSLAKEKSRQVFIIMKYQKQVLNVFVYQ